MSEGNLPPIPLLIRLVSEFCVPAIKGQVTGQAPVAGTELSADTRRSVGISTPGRTLGYPARDATVFLDLNEQRAQVWFIHPDAQLALEPVERALAEVAPGILLIHAGRPMPGLGERIYLVDLGNNRGMRVEISHPAGGPENFFVVRTSGLQISDRQSFESQLSGGKAIGQS